MLYLIAGLKWKDSDFMACIINDRVNASKEIAYSDGTQCDDKSCTDGYYNVLKSFYKKLFAGNCIVSIGCWLVTGLFVFIEIVNFCLPYQEVSSDGNEYLSIVLFTVIIPSFTYIQPYLRFKDKGQNCTVYDRVKYLPISLKVMRSFWLRKLVSFQLKTFIVCIVLQNLFAVLFFHELILANILYPLLMGFVIPVLVNSVYLLLIR